MSFRDHFDLPRDQIYLNCAYMGPMPRAAVEAGSASYDRKARPWEFNVQRDFFDLPDALRVEAATLFSAAADDIALVPAASYGLATAAKNLKPETGSEILVLDGQFPSNVYVWRGLARETGASVRTVRRSANESWTDAVLPAIGPQTAILALPGVHWADGGRLDLAAIGKKGRAHGAALVLDLTQSLGAAPFDLAGIKPDYAVAAAYKWLLGPYSMGFLYVAPERRSDTPLEENWIVRDRAEDFARLVDYADGYARGARKFDMGERSAFQLVPAALESLTLLNGTGLETIAAGCAERVTALEAAVQPLGLHTDTPDRAGHYLCLTLPEGAPTDLAARLGQRNVHVSQRGDRLRVTPHLYNGDTDIAAFADAVKAEL
ncbi:aminotransferase class V-fold PLP-dependent enzyme [Hyphobacterium marinum]|uniref:Aminotransferase class V-fold PLP-dependent enzyme n=1 Tax=Hyphobacterium marinum TaxID=3116574 RepID=A0ABU7LXX7_9PROT|nr:aminotransferase class V-fold PLP-dependent enzyme [Hyphobacterium sp. Y6023]MEE2566390.1 aminotransferase class V-fold PLP-dependent enzyme [Hyphobacterium sp. Y6023]